MIHQRRIHPKMQNRKTPQLKKMLIKQILKISRRTLVTLVMS